MPELPEVETVVRGLRPYLVGRCIDRVIAIDRRVLRSRPGRLTRLNRAVVSDVLRVGKFIRIRVNEGMALVVHLGMAGRLVVARARSLVPAHTYLRLGIAGRPADASLSRTSKSAIRDRLELRYVNPRWAIGGVWLTDGLSEPTGSVVRAATGRSWTRGLQETLSDPTLILGPDPLDISADEFVRLLRAHRRQVKALLLDQRILAGLGNIYCDESLFSAGIHPRALSSQLGVSQCRRLWRAIRRTLQSAIRAGGSTLRDYRNADGQPGWFQTRLAVYGRAGLPCPRCGRAIRHSFVAGRSTHFCPGCQTG